MVSLKFLRLRPSFPFLILDSFFSKDLILFLTAVQLHPNCCQKLEIIDSATFSRALQPQLSECASASNANAGASS